MSCAVRGCDATRHKGEIVKFFSIPSLHAPGKSIVRKKANNILRERQTLWLQALHLNNITEDELRCLTVCSKHFVTGEPAPTGEKDHVDYVPCINMDPMRRNKNVGPIGRNQSTRKRSPELSTNNGYTKAYKPRNIYQRWANKATMCRVCLTQSPTMFDLSNEIDDADDNSQKMPIIQVLQIVTSTTINLHPKLPQCICPVCMSMLKMAYRFIVQFKDSQTKLKNEMNIEPIDNQMTVEIQPEHSNRNSKNGEVEVIVDENRYDLNDIVYVEEDDETGEDKYDVFLSKLGKEITATFASEKRDDAKQQNDTSAITILMKEKDSLVPVRELEIDDAAEVIRVELESDDCSLKDNTSMEHYVSDSEGPPLELRRQSQKDDRTTVKESSRDHIYSEAIREFNSEEEKMIESFIIHDPETTIVRRRKRRIRRPQLHKSQVRSNQEKVFECKRCGAQFATRSAFKTHTIKHDGKTFSCETCGRSYYTKHNLKDHMYVHTGGRVYLCNVCGKEFSYSTGLAYHMRLHTGEKRYQCAYCAKLFRMSSALKRHERTHTGEKPFQCKFCSRQFSSKSEVSSHEHVHTGFKPYRCKFCKKGFIKTHNLKLHLLQHCGPHNCDICDRTFIEEAILRMHYKVSHANLVPDVDLSGWKLSDYFEKAKGQRYSEKDTSVGELLSMYV
ncbi:unnamed protein product [Acanthoscelides obtectus]|uniref:Uncharacterized protein n=1 Tax=Acanthoscelides obtectus TaxID=200917 RepID=A0A9P0K4C2_ACAOB|nr:unnamed protein product [Acanthoscelides obtectus]CAK1631474.1 Zinc finger protein 214 [Acanthoscelides obtectus]